MLATPNKTVRPYGKFTDKEMIKAIG